MMIEPIPHQDPVIAKINELAMHIEVLSAKVDGIHDDYARIEYVDSIRDEVTALQCRISATLNK